MARRRIPTVPSAFEVNRVLLGVVCVVVISAACAAAFAFGALGLGKDQYTMSGVFADATGVSKASDVMMAGISVGTVTGVHPDFQAGEVVITWKVNRGVHLGPDTTADVELANLLGGQYIRLAGPVRPPYLDSLPAGQRRIPLSRTHSTQSITAVLGSAAQDVQQVNPAVVNNVILDLTGVVGGTQQTFGPLLANLASVSAAINQRDADLRQLIHNTQGVTAALAAKDQQIGQLIDTAGGLLNQLIARRDQLATILGAGSTAVSQLSNVIAAEQAHLRVIVDDLHVGITAAAQDLPQINQGFAWAGPTFADLGSINTRGPVDAVLNNVTLPVGGDFLTMVERVLEGSGR